jgi:hypothetical protein
VPTVSELKERARGFEQKGELATALKVYRHILAHLEGTPALAAELPLYVKIGDLSAKLGAGADAVEMYRKAGTHYAHAGSAKSLMALALKVQRVDPSRGDLYGQFAQDLLSQGHYQAAAQMMREAAERSGLEHLRAALEWATERPEEESRGVLVRLAEALVQGGAAAEREAEAITAPPAPVAPPDEPLLVERIGEAEPPAVLPVTWPDDEPAESPEEPEATVLPPSDLGLVTDRWREALEQVAAPSPKGTEPPAWPEPPTPEPPRVEPFRTEFPPPPEPPVQAPLEIEPLVIASAIPPALPVEEREPLPERGSVRSAPRPSFGRVLVDEHRPRRGKGWVIVAGVVVVLGGAAAAVLLDLVPLGRGGAGTGATPVDRPAPPPVTDSAPGNPAASPPAADTAVPPAPVFVTRDPARARDTARARVDTALPPPGDTTALAPVPVPMVEPPTVAPPPIVRLDTTPTGPPTVRVPAGTPLRDMLIVVPGMPVDSVVAVAMGGRRGHRIVQRLGDGESLVLTSAPMTGTDTVGISDVRITVAGDTTVGSVRFWSFLVTARARADADTLARLLRRLVRARPVR